MKGAIVPHQGQETGRLMRMAVLIAAGLLAGCNMVTSPKPLFFAQDAVGQPQLRPGVWVDEQPGCPVDTDKPRDQWPDCADTWIVRPNEIVAAKDKGKPSDAGDHYPMLLAKGDPAVMQIALADDGGGPPTYVYIGLRVLKRDGQGRVVEYKMWPALCGPPPPPADPSPDGDPMLTRHPIDGLVIDRKNHDCVASEPGPVRVSVEKSEAWSDTGAKDDEGRDRARWVRDGER
jgi:hypothetical protein